MKKHEYLMLAFAILFVTLLVPSVTAETYPQNTDLKFSITSNFATECVLTNLDTPTNVISIFQNGTKNSQTFNFTIDSTNLSELGSYKRWIECSDGTDKVTSYEVFKITTTGYELNMETTIVYIIILLFLIGLLCYIGYLYPRLPKNETNSDGYVINASQMTYLRPIAIGFMWLLTMGITYIVANIAIAYLPVAFLGNFLFGLWTIMMYSNLVILPLWVLWIIISSFRQAKIKEFLERGGMAFG